MRNLLGVLLGLAVIGVGAPPAGADEAKARVSASMLLNILAPAEPRASAFDEALKEGGPAPRPQDGEVLEDGTVRYGRVVVTVKNPCPPGTAHYEPLPLPGRRVRK
jgi:hypothetical protein